MTRFLAIFVLFAVWMHQASAQTSAPFFKGPQPIAVLLETNPWAGVIGSDTPQFVLYEDGQVIYRKQSRTQAGPYFSKRLSPGELKNLKAKLLAVGGLKQGRQRLEIAEVSDQPETMLYLKLDHMELAVSLYRLGMLHDSRDDGRSSTPLPAALGRLHTLLSGLKFEGAQPWVPPYVEAMVWDYDYAPQASIVWPKEWPGLQSPSAVKRRQGYSIFLPGTESGKLQAFLARRNPKGAVEIDGKKFAAEMRPTFPSEPVWRKAFEDQ